MSALAAQCHVTFAKSQESLTTKVRPDRMATKQAPTGFSPGLRWPLASLGVTSREEQRGGKGTQRAFPRPWDSECQGCLSCTKNSLNPRRLLKVRFRFWVYLTPPPPSPGLPCSFTPHLVRKGLFPTVSSKESRLEGCQWTD